MSQAVTPTQQGNRTETVMFIFLILGLLVCTEAQGISAGTPVFVLKGEDVLLNVTEAVVLGEFDLFVWKCNESSIVRLNSKDKKVSANYTGRLEFPENNYSVKLKNLQEADSGVYSAEVTKESTEEVTKYNVKVQDRASLPLLTVSSVSRNSSSCSFTVTCSSQDSHINSTFTCDNQTCSQEGGERSDGIPDTFLQVHQLSGSIICNHSNHVSWTNTTKIIKDVCHQHDDPEGLSVCLVKTCVFSVGLIIMVSAVSTVHLMEKLNNNK
ncbi:SLAM family member 7-like [Gymnodraco acuticeps]|uniref:SLAM family member 7-like n=1 Tax=Gymnodraco acuticeps TaxID=8218 RepID=A0A6P8TYM4_GYMAC|nr:SLAM family member 7-like [Gymnodraco acuticeps]